MTRNEATLLILLVLAVALAAVALCGVEMHAAHEIGRQLDPARFAE